MSEFSQRQRLIDRMQDVPDNLSKEEIYSMLDERIPYLKRHECITRTFEESGVNSLLDQLIKLEKV